MPTALRKRSISAPVTPDASETVRGSGSLAPKSKVSLLLDKLRDLGAVEEPQTNELISLAMLGEALEYLLTQPMPVSARWNFAQSLKVGVGNGKILRTDDAGLVVGADTLPASMIDGIADGIPTPLQSRGGHTGSAFPAQSTGATGSGPGGTIVRGDFWTANSALTLSGVPVTAAAMLIALTNNPAPARAGDWLVVPVAKLPGDKYVRENFNGGYLLGEMGWYSNENKAVFDLGGGGAMLPSGLGDYAGAGMESFNLSSLAQTEWVAVTLKPENATNIGMYVALEQNVASDYGAGNRVFVDFESGVGWRAVSRSGGVQTLTSFVMPVPLANQTFKVAFLILSGGIAFFVNGVERAFHSTNIMERVTRDYYVRINFGKNVTAAVDNTPKNCTVRNVTIKKR